MSFHLIQFPVLVLASGEQIRLDGRNTWIIGRHTRNTKIADIDLEPFGAKQFGVSRAHIRIQFVEDGSYILEDLHSRRATLLNFSRIAPGQQYTLKDGDSLSLGALQCVFVLKMYRNEV